MARRTAKGRRTRFRLRRWLGGLVVALLALALIPVALTLLYLMPFVHPISTLMAKDIVTLQGYQRDWVPLEEIAPVLVHSVVMSEDGQFCSHRGIDWGALNEVIDDALAGEQTRGASTIPMQTVKNLFLWQGRSFIRKALEAPMALAFDAVASKKRIMEIYLNIVEWASRHLWRRSRRAASFRSGRRPTHAQAGGAARRDAAQPHRTHAREAHVRSEQARQSHREAYAAGQQPSALPEIARENPPRTPQKVRNPAGQSVFQRV